MCEWLLAFAGVISNIVQSLLARFVCSILSTAFEPTHPAIAKKKRQKVLWKQSVDETDATVAEKA